MNRKRLQTITDSGEGKIRVGDLHGLGAWRFQGRMGFSEIRPGEWHETQYEAVEWEIDLPLRELTGQDHALKVLQDRAAAASYEQVDVFISPGTGGTKVVGLLGKPHHGMFVSRVAISEEESVVTITVSNRHQA